MGIRKGMSGEQFSAMIFREADEREQRRQKAAAKQRFGSKEYFAALFGEDTGKHPASGVATPDAKEGGTSGAGASRTGAAPVGAAPQHAARTNPAPPHASSATVSRHHRGDTADTIIRSIALGPDRRIAAKAELLGRHAHEYQYEYDDAGRLTEVRCNGRRVESYAYDADGRRTASRSEAHGPRPMRYDYRGMRLLAAGDCTYHYAADGTLRCKRERGRGSTYYFYGEHGGLDSAKLPGGSVIRWERNQFGLPLTSTQDDAPVERWHWHDLTRMARHDDLRRGQSTTFHYTEGTRIPHAMTVTDAHGATTYRLGTDQVGTIKTVADMDGNLVQAIKYDSFGNVVAMQDKHFPLPLGFAGGAVDRFTGLIRFGHRDYDPATGRFTNPDPLGDTGGDHDLYEYCVDDPINAMDPQGTFPLPVAFLVGKLAGAGIAALGLNAAAVAAGSPDVTVNTGDKKIKTNLHTAVTAGAASPMAINTAMAAGLAAPQAAAGAAKAADVVGATSLNALGKTVNAVGKASPTAAGALLKPELYNGAADAIGSYLPTGTPAPSKWGYAGAGASNAKKILKALADPKALIK